VLDVILQQLASHADPDAVRDRRALLVGVTAGVLASVKVNSIWTI